MKNLAQLSLIALLSLILVTAPAMATNKSPKKCVKLATQAALEEFKGREVEDVICKKRNNRGLGPYSYDYRCVVAGSNGDGAGDFEMLIVLNHDCTEVKFSKVLGEE